MNVITISSSKTGSVICIIPDTQVAMEAQSDALDLTKTSLRTIYIALTPSIPELRFSTFIFKQFTI